MNNTSPMRFIRSSSTKRFLIVLSLIVVATAPDISQAQKKQPVPKKAPVAVSSPATILTKQEQEILDEINLARANPAQYARYVTDYRKLYKGADIFFADGTSIITNEGTKAVDEAMEFLRLAKPEPPLQVRNGLVLAARTHLQDLLTTGKFGHKGSDGSVPEQRINRFGSWQNEVGENIVYKSRTARENVISLIIDDGTANRGHRKNIFKSTYRVIGIASNATPASNRMCVITFAGDFVDKTATPAKAATRF